MVRNGLILRALIRISLVLLALAPIPLLSTGAQTGSQIELAVDTANFNQDGLMVLFGALRLGGDVGLPIAAGDINNDGRADVIFCAMYGTAGAGSRANNGQVNFYLSTGQDSGFLDAATSPASFSTLIGADRGDLLGTSVATGDLNGDGIRDVAIGAAGDDGPANSRFNCGAAYVALGSPSFAMNADLATLDGNPPPGVIAIYGAQREGRTGIWIDVGDIDGDGLGDVVVGSDELNSSRGNHVGGAYVIFGSRALPSVIDLASPPAGVRTARIFGADQEDHWGAALHIGDINNDAVADLVIGGSIFRDSAGYVTPEDQDSGHNDRGASFGGTRNRCGEVFVVYGSRNWPAEIDLSSPPAASTHVIGAGVRDLLGSQLHSADINGDGKTDLIMGALQALAPDSRGRTGAVYVVYGSPGLQGATIDLANPQASGLQIATIYGEENLDCAGDSVRSFDINGDGMSELFVGSPEHSFQVGSELREEAGDTKIIFGRREFLPEVIKLYELPAELRVFRLAGAHGEDQGLGGGDEFSYRLAGGDVDGDGYVDYLANAMQGDGFSNRAFNAGNVYIFSGRKLSAKLGLLPPSKPTILSAELSGGGGPVQEAPAGQSGLRVVVRLGESLPSIEVTINGLVVTSQTAPTGSAQGLVQIVSLDENPAIKNTVGPLAVRVRNTNPPSEFSNEVIAGRLTGPTIASIRPKRKASGVLLLKISGSGFQDGSTASVIDSSNRPIAVRSVGFVASDFLSVKIGADAAPPSGAILRVRLITPTGVISNEATTTAP